MFLEIHLKSLSWYFAGQYLGCIINIGKYSLSVNIPDIKLIIKNV